MPIIYDVERVRDGRSFATRRVLARQHGRPIYALTASFQVAEDGFDHQDAMPDVPTPEESVDVGAALDRGGRAAEDWLREWAVLELRHAGDSRPGGALEDPEHPARVRFWVRVRDRLPDDVLVHQAALTYVSDLTLLGSALVPHGVHRRPARAGGVPRPHGVAAPAVPRRRVAALRPGLAERVRSPWPRPRVGSSPRTAGWWPRWRRRGSSDRASA